MTDAQATFPRTDLARATLGVLIIVALIALAIWILRPFLGAVVWATMIVVATWPVMRRLLGPGSPMSRTRSPRATFNDGCAKTSC